MGLSNNKIRTLEPYTSFEFIPTGYYNRRMLRQLQFLQQTQPCSLLKPQYPIIPQSPLAQQGISQPMLCSMPREPSYPLPRQNINPILSIPPGPQPNFFFPPPASIMQIPPGLPMDGFRQIQDSITRPLGFTSNPNEVIQTHSSRRSKAGISSKSSRNISAKAIRYH